MRNDQNKVIRVMPSGVDKDYPAELLTAQMNFLNL